MTILGSACLVVQAGLTVHILGSRIERIFLKSQYAFPEPKDPVCVNWQQKVHQAREVRSRDC